MKRVVFFTLIAGFAGAALAAPPDCGKMADEKKLSGDAKTKYVKKCENDALMAAVKACQKQADDKNLEMGAKTSFVTDCTKAAMEMK